MNLNDNMVEGNQVLKSEMKSDKRKDWRWIVIVLSVNLANITDILRKITKTEEKEVAITTEVVVEVAITTEEEIEMATLI